MRTFNEKWTYAHDGHRLETFEAGQECPEALVARADQDGVLEAKVVKTKTNKAMRAKETK